MRARRTMATLGAMLAGCAVGVGAALLYAPQSGERTRRLIKRKAEDVGEEARDLYGRLKDGSDEAVRRLRYRVRMRLGVRNREQPSVS